MDKCVGRQNGAMILITQRSVVCEPLYYPRSLMLCGVQFLLCVRYNLHLIAIFNGLATYTSTSINKLYRKWSQRFIYRRFGWVLSMHTVRMKVFRSSLFRSSLFLTFTLALALSLSHSHYLSCSGAIKTNDQNIALRIAGFLIGYWQHFVLFVLYYMFTRSKTSYPFSLRSFDFVAICFSLLLSSSCYFCGVHVMWKKRVYQRQARLKLFFSELFFMVTYVVITFCSFIRSFKSFDLNVQLCKELLDFDGGWYTTHESRSTTLPFWEHLSVVYIYFSRFPMVFIVNLTV